jgi:hypothetical protein
MRGQIVHAGFMKPTDDIHLQWKEVNVSQGIEYYMTDGHRLLQPNREYIHALRTFEPFKDLNEPYRRIYSKDVNEFGTVYDEMDISVAYLKDNNFNSCKSELKMIEAGFKGVAVMCSTKAPYSILATDKNCFDLSKKTFREWARYLIKNPNLVADSASQLREDVERYDLNKLSSKRNEIYKKYI